MRRQGRLLRLLLPLLAVASWVAPGIALGQLPPELVNSTPQERAKMMTLVMKEKLALTQEQLPKVEAINLDAAQKLEPILKGSERPLMEMRDAKQIQQAKQQALQGVLSPEQFQQFLAGQEEMKQKVEEKLRERKPGAAQ